MAASGEGDRLERLFQKLQIERRTALITFVTAGDPDLSSSLEILKGLPGAGSYIIELGMPFTDPMADGPSIQAAGLRALAAGQNMQRTLQMVEKFRLNDHSTPVILMGYYNPIFAYGVPSFVKKAVEVGVDGLIIVDLPPETDDELCVPAKDKGLHFIRLATPTTNDARLPMVLQNTSGFLYYVSITGITGASAAGPENVKVAVNRLRGFTDLPIAVGFGIRTPRQAGEVAAVADAVVVGSALVDEVTRAISSGGDPIKNVLTLTVDLAAEIRKTDNRIQT